MERKKCVKYIIIAWLSFSVFVTVQAQLSPKERVYRAYISDRMDDWDQVIVELSSRKVSLSDNQLGDLINFYYGYTGWAIGEGLDKKAIKYIQYAEEIIDDLRAKYPENPDWYAYKGAFIGYKIGLNKIKAVVLGPESIKNINRAVELGPARPQGWIEKGNALFYMPTVFGGSKEKALEAYNKALQLIEIDAEMVNRNWMYLNVLMVIGQSYEKIENFQMAKITYEKVLRIEPDFTYMREKLLRPVLLKLEAQETK